jgi:3-methyladenine DNA glycosylase AlkC
MHPWKVVEENRWELCPLLPQAESLPKRIDKSLTLTRIIHDLEDTKSLFCYKHVV